MLQIITMVCFAATGIQVATSQYLSRQPNLIYNRQIPETIIETPLIYPQTPPVYQPIREVQSLPTPLLRDIQPLLNPTTIITDCTPAVCKTLTDIIQLMSVANLIKDKQGGADVALQLAEPFLKEIMLSQSYPYLTSSPNLINPSVISPCLNPVSNLINPNLISPVASLYRNVGSPGVISNLPILPTRSVSNGNANALVGNLLSMLGN